MSAAVGLTVGADTPDSGVPEDVPYDSVSDNQANASLGPGNDSGKHIQ